MSIFDPRGSFRSQLVALTAGVTAIGVVALTIVVQLVLARSTEHSLDTVLEDRTETVISSISRAPGGGLLVPDDLLDAGVAVYSADGRLAAGSIPRSERTIYADLATVRHRRTVEHPGSDETRVLAEPFTTGDGTSGVVVVTERLSPYERAERQALLVCVGAGILMIALAAGLALWVSRRALAPVAEMTRAADDWSEHDLTHRFDLGPGGNEIAGLGRTLDRLLERVATAIRSEHRLTSELAHELRTPLAVIRANADLTLSHELAPASARDGLEEIAAAAGAMGATIEGLLELARSHTGQELPGSCGLRDAVIEAVGPLDDRSIDIAVDPAVRVQLPQALAVRAISPIVANARRLARRIDISSAPVRSGYVDLYVDDDGPGIPTSQRELVFEPGHTTGQGAGLGLALSRRVARSMGGDVRVAEGPLTTRLLITLPAA